MAVCYSEFNLSTANAGQGVLSSWCALIRIVHAGDTLPVLCCVFFFRGMSRRPYPQYPPSGQGVQKQSLPGYNAPYPQAPHPQGGQLGGYHGGTGVPGNLAGSVHPTMMGMTNQVQQMNLGPPGVFV